MRFRSPRWLSEDRPLEAKRSCLGESVSESARERDRERKREREREGERESERERERGRERKREGGRGGGRDRERQGQVPRPGWAFFALGCFRVEGIGTQLHWYR